MAPDNEVTYPLDRSEWETRRLQQQARLYQPLYEHLLGMIEPGMKVLDVGCGGGEFTVRAAQAAGPAGLVVGVDLSPIVLEIGRARASQAGLTNVSFELADLRTASVDDDFDAIIGGRVLLYTPDPSEALRAAASHARSGALVAFQDMQYISTVEYAESRPLPVWRQTVGWIGEALVGSGAHLDTGFGLHSAFVEIGLGPPEMMSLAPMGGPRGWEGFDFVADTSRSLLSAYEKLRMQEAASQDFDSLASRLAQEVERAACPIQLFTFVNLWSHKP